MKMTKESLLKVIGAVDDVTSALAGTNDEVHKDDTDKMVRLWDDLNDQYAPPEVVRELARMALAAMDSKPVLEIESEPVFTLEVAREDYKGQKLGNHFGFITLDAARELKEGNYQLYTAQPAPVVPDGYVMVPMRLTAENGAKGALSGEFSETKFVNCPECFGDDECETCDGSGRIEITVPVTWTTIKEIWAKGVEHFAAAPQEVKP